MSSEIVGVAGILAALFLMGLRVPIAVALGLVSVVGITILRGPDPALSVMGYLPFDFASNWILSAIPMFLLMGAISYHSGLTGSLFRAARVWFEGVPGGLAVATNFASAGFAAASGSSVATSASMGKIAIPEMLSFNYDKGLATATVAASGTLGALIPPSIAFIVYGWFTAQPVSALLIAGILPGLLTAIVYAVMIMLRCMHNPTLAPKYKIEIGRKEKWQALIDVWPIPLLILCIIGGIYGGIATPGEAGALGAIFATVIAFFGGQMNWEVLKNSVSEAVVTTASLLFIAVGALMLTRFLAMSGIPNAFASAIISMELSPLLLILGLSVVYLVLGMFLEPLGILLLTLPIFLPAFNALDMNLIWIGVIVVKYLEIGLMTPPVGMQAYVVKSVVGDTVPLTTIFHGLKWFLFCEVIIMILLIAFPEISLFLPSRMQ